MANAAGERDSEGKRQPERMLRERASREGSLRRSPRMWALRLAAVALAAAAVTTLVMTVADRPAHTVCHRMHSASAAELWRGCQWSGVDKGGSGTGRWLVGDLVRSALPSRPAVAWSLAAGTITWVESLRPLSSSRWWLGIALVTGESVPALLPLNWHSLSVLSARRRRWTALRLWPGDLCQSDRLPRARQLLPVCVRVAGRRQ